MSTNTIATLRDQLFATLEALQDKKNPMDVERAKAITDVAQVIINSAKVEVEHVRVAGGKGSGFIPEVLDKPALDNPQLPAGTTRPSPGVLVHRMQG